MHVFYIDKKKKEIKIDPNNIFIYLFIFVKFSFNHSLDRQAKQPQQAVKVKSLLVHWTIGSTLGRIIHASKWQMVSVHFTSKTRFTSSR